MIKLNEAVNKFFDTSEKITLKTLFEEVEKALDVFVAGPLNEAEEQQRLTLDLIPTISISELGWGSLVTPEGSAADIEDVQAGSAKRTASGQQLAQFLKNIEGTDIKEKIKYLSEFMDTPIQTQAAGAPPVEQIKYVISNLVFFKTLTEIITNFNAASAGFAFESFLAVLLDAETGRQIPATGASTIADLTLFKGTKAISLKLYKEGQLKVGGSFKQLIEDLTGKNPTMEYIVVTKNIVTKDNDNRGLPSAQYSGDLNFYAFNFTLDNFLGIISLKEKELIRIPRKFMADPAELEKTFYQDRAITAPTDPEGEEKLTPGELEKYLAIPAANLVDWLQLLPNFLMMSSLNLQREAWISQFLTNLTRCLITMLSMENMFPPLVRKIGLHFVRLAKPDFQAKQPTPCSRS